MAKAILPENEFTRRNTEAAGLLEGQVRCWRCNGLMIVEASFDCAGEAVRLDCLTRRCVQCGEVVDPVILQNRRLQLDKGFGARSR